MLVEIIIGQRMFFQFISEGIPGDPQAAGGKAFVSLRFLEGMKNHLFLHAVQCVILQSDDRMIIQKTFSGQQARIQREVGFRK